MSRSSDERLSARDGSTGRPETDAAGMDGGSTARAAVEPVAALVAVVAVAAAIGLYVTAIDDATPTHERAVAEATLDRIEPAVTAGGVVVPTRLGGVSRLRYAATIEIRAGGETWRIDSGPAAPALNDPFASDRIDTARRTVTVRTAPGRNVRGTLRAAVRR